MIYFLSTSDMSDYLILLLPTRWRIGGEIVVLIFSYKAICGFPIEANNN